MEANGTTHATGAGPDAPFAIDAPSEEHRLLRETVRGFAWKEVEPGASEADRRGVLDRRLVRRAGELGLLGLTVPESGGGAGGDALASVIAHHELSKVDPGFTLA